MITDNELKALIQLLDDPDDGIFKHVSGKLLEIGLDVIPKLEDNWEIAEEVLVQQRIENLIHTIKSHDIYQQLKNWKDMGGTNLLNGAILVAKYQYHNINEEKIRSKINQIKQDVWIELNDELTALEKVKVMNHIIFNLHDFKGNKENFHAPKNSFINRVLETKKGTPLSIGIIYAIIAQGLDIPVYGVNLPHHFILAYEDQLLATFAPEELATPGILFYINTFNNGAVFGKQDVLAFLKQIDVEPEEKYFKPCTNIDIIKRMVTNISYAFQKSEKSDKEKHFKKLLQIFK
jgi:regulator of sirC expression with transglutaminase-like and TPR domain